VTLTNNSGPPNSEAKGANEKIGALSNHIKSLINFAVTYLPLLKVNTRLIYLPSQSLIVMGMGRPHPPGCMGMGCMGTGHTGAGQG
jgi:hypothetical protein